MSEIIPQTLQSDHLFLLVGTNPLPNWVSARLLLRDGGQVYLVHSKEVIEVARRLAKVLLRQGYKQPQYVPVKDASDASAVYKAVGTQVRRVPSGQAIGFNYTGGTKVMSVHGYQAMMDNLRQGEPDPLFSYLNARTLEMRFDFRNPPIFLGLEPSVSLSLEKLFELHDDATPLTKFKKDPIAWPVVQELEKLHRTLDGYKAWRRWIMQLQRNKNAANETLEWPLAFLSVAEALTQGRPLSITLQELCRERADLPFRKATQLLSWLEGEWLESYVAYFLARGQMSCFLTDYAHDMGFRFKDFHLQADVAAMRGYQLHFISCYAGHHNLTCKTKLFEAMIRARQIGGDEAGAALVCMSDDPMKTESEAKLTFQTKDRVKVFGRRELKDLDKHLERWFLTGIP